MPCIIENWLERLGRHSTHCKIFYTSKLMYVVESKENLIFYCILGHFFLFGAPLKKQTTTGPRTKASRLLQQGL